MTDSEDAAGQAGGAELALAMQAIIGNDSLPASERVVALVRLLDQAVFDAYLRDQYHGIESQILARAVAAVGRPLLGHWPMPTVAATLAAAQAYVRAPGDQTWDAYASCATSSYPYGSGDGHYGLDENCDPGTGCVTGAGTLVCVADQIGAEVVVEVLTAELLPWLRGWPDGNSK
ncbi:MAG TPA: hypothetical protein VFI65_17685 [Streptosporangiaceae bacterium]|nr:hypothetical protein [Streptosporangiaceae bacterium]